ncbi:hypothetical protein SDC9_193692 [bioreactor metagenome]|uniref:Uncharacterized protein n=1 Tax=bioreactor metagenome TaxID=1076179 RepID=A0A645I6T6_9ZZZZ
MIWSAQGVTGGGVFQAHRSCDISRITFFQVFPVIGMHLNDTTDSLLVSLCCVQNRRTGIHRARVNPEET